MTEINIANAADSSTPASPQSGGPAPRLVGARVGVMAVIVTLAALLLIELDGARLFVVSILATPTALMLS